MRERYGVFSYAVPVFSKEKELIGALGVYKIPLPGYEKEKQIILEVLQDAAGKISDF